MNSLFTNNISLDHGTHTYQLLDDPEFRFASVTEFIHEFFRKFEGEISYKGGGVLPMSGSINNFTKGQYMLVGDSAGMVLPSNGAGITTAMIGGRIAGQVIAEHIKSKVVLSEYQKRWNLQIPT